MIKIITIRMEESIRDRLKVIAAQERRTIGDVIEDMLDCRYPIQPQPEARPEKPKRQPPKNNKNKRGW